MGIPPTADTDHVPTDKADHLMATRPAVTRQGPTLRTRVDHTLLDSAMRAARDVLDAEEHLVRSGARTFTIVPGRTGQIASRVLDGESYASVCKDFGISSERVRQISEPYLTPTAREARTALVTARRDAAAHQAMLDYAHAHPEASLTEVSRQHRRFTPQQVREALGKGAQTRALSHIPTPQVRFSDQDCLDALRSAAGTDGAPLSMARYSEANDGGPSAQTIMQRFGAWATACQAAGVTSAATGRTEWPQAWSDADLEEWVTQFLTRVDPDGTITQYDTWAKEQNAAPPLATVRKRLGRWSLLRERLAPTSHVA